MRMGLRNSAQRVDGASGVLGGSQIPGRVYSVARGHTNFSLRALDIGMIAGAWGVAYLASFDGSMPFGLKTVLPYVLVAVVVQLVTNQLAGLYGPIWRYASVDEALRVVVAVASGVTASGLIIGALAGHTGIALPRYSPPPIAAFFMLIGAGGIRFQARLFALERQRTRGAESLRTLIVGAGDAAIALALELRRHNEAEVHLVGLIDEDPRMVGRSIRGLRVLGTTDELQEICRRESIDRILVAMPHASRDRVQPIIDRALRTDAQVKVLPPTSDLIGKPLVSNLRDLDLADLLGRDHAPVDPTEIAGYLRGARVLVTGAGGSIGSEIARQVSRYAPACLLLLDRDETLLHDVMATLADTEVVELLADIRDETRMRLVFAQHSPTVVFHAAAHKHVPILERHAAEAVTTNLLATWTLANIAAELDCRFVHVSTDKAVEPMSVMGASKRAAELAVLEAGTRHNLPFAAVRFGNVLGSRGSVVPTFLHQIIEGGPVTVTDEQMTRYFMTIPEAVSLVLQAGAMADAGKIFVLDMGDQVPIVELARQMIRLAGLRPDEDIKINIVGARAGERLTERLHDDVETMAATHHPSISAVTSDAGVDEPTLSFFLDLLARPCAEASDVAVASLLEQLLRHCGIDCHLDAAHPEVKIPEPTESIGAEASAAEIVDLRSLHDAERRAHCIELPALLGGAPLFPALLPFARPTRPPLERVRRRLQPSYDRGILTTGPLGAELERVVADRLGVSDVVAVSSCTSGLMLALQAILDGRPGPVVVPSFTFSASAHAIAWNSRKPAFVECLSDTFQVDCDAATAAAEGAAALLATHIFGAPCDPVRVVETARARGVPVLFDAAHAFGASAGGVPVGGFGVAEIFSLSPTKVLVAGEGGLIATNDSGLAELLRIGRDYGNPGDYDTLFHGLNARMSEFHAAMALESFDLLDEALERRRELAALYREYLTSVPGIGFQRVPPGDVTTYKDFTVTIDPSLVGLTRDELATALDAEGIATRAYFDPPVHRHRAYRDIDSGELPVTAAVASSVLSLPIYTDLRDDQVESVARAVHRAHLNAEELAAQIAASVTHQPARVNGHELEPTSLDLRHTVA